MGATWNHIVGAIEGMAEGRSRKGEERREKRGEERRGCQVFVYEGGIREL